MLKMTPPTNDEAYRMKTNDVQQKKKELARWILGDATE